jgi:hypothetical protein
MSVMALDIETKNMSYDIGGFGNTHMFQVSTVATWDGNTGTVYVDEPVDSFAKSGHIVKSLRELKYDLDEPILKNSMDIYCIKQYLEDKRYIDTSRILTKEHGERFPLSNLVKCTMNDFKLMDSADAPKLWKAGQYDEVVEYCMKDTQLVYDLWKYGQDNGIVKAFSVDKEKFVELEVKW